MSQNESRLKVGKQKPDGSGTFHLLEEMPRSSEIALPQIYNLEDSDDIGAFNKTPAARAIRRLRKWIDRTGSSPNFPGMEALCQRHQSLQSAFVEYIKVRRKEGDHDSDIYESLNRSLKLLCVELSQLFSLESFWRFACMYDYSDEGQGTGGVERKSHDGKYQEEIGDARSENDYDERDAPDEQGERDERGERGGEDEEGDPLGDDLDSTHANRSSTHSHPRTSFSSPSTRQCFDPEVYNLIVSLQSIFECYKKQRYYYSVKQGNACIADEQTSGTHCPSFPAICKGIRAYIRGNWSEDMYFWLSEAVLRYLFFQEAGLNGEADDERISAKMRVPGRTRLEEKECEDIPNAHVDGRPSVEDREPWLQYYPVNKASWDKSELRPLVALFSFVYGSRRHNRLSEIKFGEVREDTPVLPLFALYAIWAVPCLVLDLTPAFSCHLRYSLQEVLIEASATHFFSHAVWAHKSHVRELTSLFPAWVVHGAGKDDMPPALVKMEPVITGIVREPPREEDQRVKRGPPGPLAPR